MTGEALKLAVRRAVPFDVLAQMEASGYEPVGIGIIAAEDTIWDHGVPLAVGKDGPSRGLLGVKIRAIGGTPK